MTSKQRVIGEMLERNRDVISGAYKRGWSSYRIARTLRVGPETVGRYLRRWGVKMRPTGNPEWRRRAA